MKNDDLEIKRNILKSLTGEFDRHTPIRVKIFDIYTGESHWKNIDGYGEFQWSENNGSCACARNISEEEVHCDTGRFIIIDVQEDYPWDKIDFLRRCNEMTSVILKSNEKEKWGFVK